MQKRPRKPYVPCRHLTPEGECLLPWESTEHDHDANPPLATSPATVVGVIIAVVLILFTVIVGWEKLSTLLDGG